MRCLRDPETGCPWDIEQDFDSIAPHMIEEAYEVLDAIQTRDHVQLRSELGDLLLQVVFLSRIAEESEQFDFQSVVESLTTKLVRRHPHVFADGAPVASARAQVENWELHKSRERRQNCRASELDGIAAALPALMRADKVQQRASGAGYDFADEKAAITSARLELCELIEASESGDPQAREEEIGDLLFSVVNVARHLDVDAETALRNAIDKFSARFRKVEELLNETDSRFDDLCDARRDELWELAKSELAVDSQSRSRGT